MINKSIKEDKFYNKYCPRQNYPESRCWHYPGDGVIPSPGCNGAIDLKGTHKIDRWTRSIKFYIYLRY
jgi:hypothetical protein